MKYFLAILLLAASLPAQDQESLDPCDNFSTTEPAHRCKCYGMTDTATCPPGGEKRDEPKCDRNCHLDHCHCVSACDT